MRLSRLFHLQFRRLFSNAVHLSLFSKQVIVIKEWFDFAFLQDQKKSLSLSSHRHRFPIRTIRQTRFGVLTTCKRNWDLRRSRSLSHLDLEDRFQTRRRSVKKVGSFGKGSREEDFDLLIVRPPILKEESSKKRASCDRSLMRSKSMVEIMGSHVGVVEGAVFFSEC